MADGSDPTLFLEVLYRIRRALELRALDLGCILVSTTIAISVLNRLAPRLGLMDRPDGGRKTHGAATPLTGGVALLIGVGIGTMASLDSLGVDLEVLMLLGIVVTIHALDDQAGLSARQRLVVDAMIALSFTVITGATIESAGVIFGAPFHLGVLGAPITIFAYLALTNAFNMLDGVDGLAISQFLIAILSLGFWHLSHAPNSGFDPLTIAIIAAALPLLAANLGILGARMKCFLGDAGSRFLGFFLVYALISEGTRTLSPTEAAYLIALPLLDMCAVVTERVRAGCGVMRADRRHLHHLLIDSGAPQWLTVLLMAGLSLSFVALLWLMTAADLSDLVGALIFVVLTVAYVSCRRRAIYVLAGLLTPRNRARAQ